MKSSHLVATGTPAGSLVAKCLKAPQVESVEVFLLYPCKVRRKGAFDRFFYNNFNDLEQRVSERPVFLNREQAVNYASFLNERLIMIAAQVSENAILADGHGFSLRQGTLTRRQLKYARLLGDTERSVANPYFASDMLLAS